MEDVELTWEQQKDTDSKKIYEQMIIEFKPISLEEIILCK